MVAASVDSVTNIGDFAFFYCTGLASVSLGNGVASIGAAAFAGCASLTSVTTTLAPPSWAPWQSGTLTNGLIYFTDPQWTNYPTRFYSIRSP